MVLRSFLASALRSLRPSELVSTGVEMWEGRWRSASTGEGERHKIRSKCYIPCNYRYSVYMTEPPMAYTIDIASPMSMHIYVVTPLQVDKIITQLYN